MKKIIFTGGHHNSALTVAREIKQQELAEVVWFGHKYTMLGDKSVSAEYQEVTKSEIRFRELKAGKFYKTFHPIHLMRLPFGFLQAFVYLIQEKPDLIVSFGGYLAAPVVVMGSLLGIPSVSHEQTIVVGLANKYIARFAKKIFVTWPQSKKYLPAEKVVLTGLPLRKRLNEFDQNNKYFENEKKTIYITGGKQGSNVINRVIGESLGEILKHYNVIHQCGGNTKTKDFEYLSNIRDHLSTDMKENYILKKYLYEDEIGQVFNTADVVISRAGAHITYELAALGKPTIFIPISWVSHNEQYKNARILVNAGSATILAEDRLDSSNLLKEIVDVMNKLDYFKSQGESLKKQIVLNATERIVNEIKTILV